MSDLYPKHLYYSKASETSSEQLCGLNVQLEEKIDVEFNELTYNYEISCKEFACTFPNLMSEKFCTQMERIITKLENTQESQLQQLLNDKFHSGIDLRGVKVMDEFVEEFKRLNLPSLIQQWCKSSNCSLSHILEKNGYLNAPNQITAEQLCSNLTPIQMYIVKYNHSESHPLHVDDSFLTLNICVKRKSHTQHEIDETTRYTWMSNPLHRAFPDRFASSGIVSKKPVNLTKLYLGVDDYDEFELQLSRGELEIWHPKIMKMDHSTFDNRNDLKLRPILSKMLGCRKEKLRMLIPSSQGRLSIHFGAAPHYAYPIYDSTRYNIIIWFNLTAQFSSFPLSCVNDTNNNNDISNDEDDQKQQNNNDDDDGDDGKEVSSKKMIKLEDLPQEVLENMYIYLPIRTLVVLTTLNRKLLRSLNSPSLWRSKLLSERFLRDLIQFAKPEIQIHTFRYLFPNINNNPPPPPHQQQQHHHQSQSVYPNERFPYCDELKGIFNDYKTLVTDAWNIVSAKMNLQKKFRDFFMIGEEIHCFEKGSASEVAELLEFNNVNLSFLPSISTANVGITMLKKVTEIYQLLAIEAEFISHLPWFMQSWSRYLSFTRLYWDIYVLYNTIFNDFKKFVDWDKLHFDTIHKLKKQKEKNKEKQQKEIVFPKLPLGTIVQLPARKSCRYSLLSKELAQTQMFLEEEKQQFDEQLSNSFKMIRYTLQENTPSLLLLTQSINPQPLDRNPIFKEYFSVIEEPQMFFLRIPFIIVITEEAYLVFEHLNCFVYSQLILFTTAKKSSLKYEDSFSNPQFQKEDQDVIITLPCQNYSCLLSDYSLCFDHLTTPIFGSLNSCTYGDLVSGCASDRSELLLQDIVFPTVAIHFPMKDWKKCVFEQNAQIISDIQQFLQPKSKKGMKMKKKVKKNNNFLSNINNNNNNNKK